jgi:hypothetical protein
LQGKPPQCLICLLSLLRSGGPEASSRQYHSWSIAMVSRLGKLLHQCISEFDHFRHITRNPTTITHF